MIIKCSTCNKDCFISDVDFNNKLFENYICVHCKNTQQHNKNINANKGSGISKIQELIPYTPKVSLSTILLLLTLLVLIFVLYGIPMLQDLLDKDTTQENIRLDDPLRLYEKDPLFFYRDNLPVTEVIIEDNIVTGFDTKKLGVSEPQQLVIPEGVTQIAAGAFKDLHGLTGVTFPSTLEEIGKNAFENCYNLEYVDLNENLKKIHDYAFFRLDITSITLPSSLEYIGVSALNYVKAGMVTIPPNADLGSNCFKFDLYTPEGHDIKNELIVNNLYVRSPSKEVMGTHYDIPEGITSIEDGAFYYSTALESVTIPEGVLYIAPMAFSQCSSLKEITFPDSLIAIDEKAFYNCESLEQVNFNEGLETIGKQSFAYSNLSKVKLPLNINVSEDSFMGTPWYNNEL